MHPSYACSGPNVFLPVFFPFVMNARDALAWPCAASSQIEPPQAKNKGRKGFGSQRMPRPSLCLGQGRSGSSRQRADVTQAQKKPSNRAQGECCLGHVTASIAGLAVRLEALAGRRPGEGAGEWEKWEEWENWGEKKSGGGKMGKNEMALMSGTRNRLASAVLLSCPPSFFPRTFSSQKARREGKKRG